MKLALLVNPIAGMGGQVALKGTDGLVEKARELGAKPISPQRASVFLKFLVAELRSAGVPDVHLFVAPAPMGAQLLGPLFAELGCEVLDVPLSSPDTTSAADTQTVVQEFERLGVSLILFVGGDGTSVDVAQSLTQGTPILGVPSGVKTYGAVFVHSPEEAAKVVASFVQNPVTREAEILDLDEDAYRRGELQVQLLGHAHVPALPEYFQLAKTPTLNHELESDVLSRVGEELAERFAQAPVGTLFVVGPGSTLDSFAQMIGFERSVLGVDVVVRQEDDSAQVLLLDAREDQLFDLLTHHDLTYLLVTPIGGQGFLFGRGNHQLSARVLRYVGKQHIWVVASPQKLRSVQGGVLRVDTRDSAVDELLAGYIRVIVDRGEEEMVRVVR